MRPLARQAGGERVRWTDGDSPAVGSRNRSERARGAPWEPGLEGCTDGRWRTARWEAGAGGRARGRLAPQISQSWGGDWSKSYSGMGSGSARSKAGD